MSDAGVVDRALLFLDVDGTLLPIGSAAPVFGAGPDQAGNPLLARLDPALGPLLRALPCELIWATTWMDEANDVISPRLGLPSLPVVPWSERAAGGDESLHWKTPDLVAFAAGRPFVWLDDEISDADQAWVTRHHPGPALLVRVDRLTGVTQADLIAITGWLRVN